MSKRKMNDGTQISYPHKRCIINIVELQEYTRNVIEFWSDSAGCIPPQHDPTRYLVSCIILHGFVKCLAEFALCNGAQIGSEMFLTMWRDYEACMAYSPEAVESGREVALEIAHEYVHPTQRDVVLQLLSVSVSVSVS